MARAFVMRPFGIKKDSEGKVFDFDDIHAKLIEPALLAAGFSGSTTGEIIESGNIREDMFALILEADLVICDVSIHNANVFYELGIRHALRKRRTLLIKGSTAADNIPFDLLTDRYLPYNSDKPEVTKEDLIKMINASMISDRQTDSPIFKMLPALPESNPHSVQVLPIDFQEEVERAEAAGSKGWLRLLAQDVQGLRFEQLGLEHIANAQWNLLDYEGARTNFENIRNYKKDNISVNLALASIYERQYRSSLSPELLVYSNQAIDRVLVNKDVDTEKRTEALALKGRNLKTLWRVEFEKTKNPEERCQMAMNTKLCDSYEAYQLAFYQDLNHFYSGLNALQMGTIFLELSSVMDDSWKAIFESDSIAEKYRERLVEEIKLLETLVNTSINVALMKAKNTGSKNLWAEISKADLLFIKEQNEKRIIKFYEKAISKNNLFAWDGAKGQLQLFADLNIKVELTKRIITSIEQQLESEPDTEKKSTHLIIFVGHRFDEKGRKDPRLPVEYAERARALIREKLEKLKSEKLKEEKEPPQLVGLASGSPGGDILFHEVCLDLKIPTTLCLPMPSPEYVKSTFKELDEWRSKYIKLTETESIKSLVLSDRDGLPHWLNRPNTDPWERGNRWVLQMALTSDAKKLTLIALWDGEPQGAVLGGTAHMVEITKATSKVHFEQINTKKELLPSKKTKLETTSGQ